MKFGKQKNTTFFIPVYTTHRAITQREFFSSLFWGHVIFLSGGINTDCSFQWVKNCEYSILSPRLIIILLGLVLET